MKVSQLISVCLIASLAFGGSLSAATYYPNVGARRTKVQDRPAYKKMLQVARPDGVPNAPHPLPKQ